METTPRTAVRSPIRVLLVEDNPGDARLVELLLDEANPEGFEVTRCDRLGEALALLGPGGSGFEVVLLDLSLPDSAGLQTVERARAGSSETPIVVMSGQDDEETALRALQGGAEDYLIKGRGDGELVARVIRYSIERAKAQARLNYLARFDTLTGLANRALLVDRLDNALSRAERDSEAVALAVLDLDRFKAVNDSLGHARGDELLQQAARRIEGGARVGDTVARIGADEFAVLLEALEDEGDVVPTLRSILESFGEPFAVDGGGEVFMSVGVGIAVSPPSEEGAMLRDAEAALRRAKRGGRGRYEFYVPEMSARASERLALEADLRRALERDEFVVHYQPQVDLRTGEIVGAEALLRWRRGGGPKLVQPGEFIPVLEEDPALISRVGEWVMREACSQARAWEQAGRPLRVAVNVSVPQFGTGLIETVARVLGETGVESLLLELEITESLLAEDPDASTRLLEDLKAVAGVRVAIDDFGTGYSSLTRLAAFPIDLLKVDQSFVRDITAGSKSAAMAAVVVGMAHRLELGAVAEGIETVEQLRFLQAEGCDLGQGFLFSRPLPAEEFAALPKDQPFPVS